MNRRTALTLTTMALLCCGVSLSGAAVAQGQFGTAAEAKTMFDRAVAALKANETAALAAFNDKGNKDYHDRDLYVFCFESTTGKFTAIVDPALLGTDNRALKEKDGSPLGQKVFDAAQKEGTINTVSYNFPRPGTTDPVPKESYVTRVGNQSCGVGYYK